MFLNRLAFVEKEAFISLAVKAAESNGCIADEEYQMIEDYCKEMGIAFFDSKNLKPMEDVIRIYSEADDQNKRVAVLEIVGLMYADGGYDSKEKEFVDDFANRIGIAQDEVRKIEDTVMKYVGITRELFECIGA